MKRWISLILAICLIGSCAALFCGCGEKENGGFPVTVNDIQIKEEPKRVVVLNDALADVILYMGYDAKLVGRSTECTQQMLNVLPSVGAEASPAIDTLTSLNPDLVIADSTLSDKSRSIIEDEGITVLTLDPVLTQEGIKEMYTLLGTALGGNADGAEKGEEAYNKLFDLLKEYNTATKNIVVTDAYLYLDEQGNYCTFVKDSVEAKIFGYNGAINVFASKTSPEFHATEITDESGNVTAADEMYIRYASPTYLFLDGTILRDGTVKSDVYDKLLADPNLSGLSALKENRIYFIPRENFYRPGVTFEETLFTMIDELNKDEEAAEEASLNATEEATEIPVEVPTEAETKAEETVSDADSANGNDNSADNSVQYYFDENGEIVYY